MQVDTPEGLVCSQPCLSRAVCRQGCVLPTADGPRGWAGWPAAPALRGPRALPSQRPYVCSHGQTQCRPRPPWFSCCTDLASAVEAGFLLPVPFFGPLPWWAWLVPPPAPPDSVFLVMGIAGCSGRALQLGAPAS